MSSGGRSGGVSIYWRFLVCLTICRKNNGKSRPDFIHSAA